jgi:hypothetical protein
MRFHSPPAMLVTVISSENNVIVNLNPGAGAAS